MFTYLLVQLSSVLDAVFSWLWAACDALLWGPGPRRGSISLITKSDCGLSEALWLCVFLMSLMNFWLVCYGCDTKILAPLHGLLTSLLFSTTPWVLIALRSDANKVIPLSRDRCCLSLRLAPPQAGCSWLPLILVLLILHLVNVLIIATSIINLPSSF